MQIFFTLGGASWTLDPSMETVNCKIKLTNSKFILVFFKKAVIIDVKIWIIQTYYSLLKLHLAGQICTASYVEYFLNF